MGTVNIPTIKYKIKYQIYNLNCNHDSNLDRVNIFVIIERILHDVILNCKETAFTQCAPKVANAYFFRHKKE